jgi:DNA-binding transcriptional regulator YdaS (Cro superfamily)
MTTEAIDLAVGIIGSMRVLAKELEITKGAITSWKNNGGFVPAEHCPRIEKLTEGRVLCEDLNSKVDWGYVRKAGVQ